MNFKELWIRLQMESSRLYTLLYRKEGVVHLMVIDMLVVNQSANVGFACDTYSFCYLLDCSGFKGLVCVRACSHSLHLMGLYMFRRHGYLFGLDFWGH